MSHLSQRMAGLLRVHGEWSRSVDTRVDTDNAMPARFSAQIQNEDEVTSDQGNKAPARITSSDIDPSACAQSDSPRLGAGWPGMSSCPGVPSMPAAYVQLATPSGRRAWFERRPSTELDACGCTRHARRAGRDEGHFDSIFPGQRR